MRSLHIAVALILGLAFRLAAQSIHGTIHDAAGAAMSNVEILVRSTAGDKREVTRSRSDGTFSLDVEAGQHLLTFRLPGYAAVDSLLIVKADTRVEVNAVMQRIASLDTVHVSGLPAACEIGQSIEGFNCRRLNTRGIFIDQVEIAKMQVIHTADIFRGIPGLVIEPTRNGRRIAPQYGWGCVTYLVNGRPRIADMSSLAKGGTAQALVGLPEPRDIVTVEVYTRYADVPPPYRTYAWAGGQGHPLTCTVINFWSR
jgi:hypothetical protein